MITDAIKCVQTEHAVYFLLTAYVETLTFTESIPETVRRLPIRGREDVRRRAEVLHDVMYAPAPVLVALKIEEAADVFDVAFEQLRQGQDSCRINCD